MNRLSENTCPESTSEPLSPSAVEKSLFRYVLRRKALLGVVGPLLLWAAGWGLNQWVEVATRNAVRAQHEQFRSEIAEWRDREFKAMVEISKKEERMADLISKAEEGSLKAETALKELAGLLPQAQKLPPLVAGVEKLRGELEKQRGELATVKNVADLHGDVNKITESLLKDKDFQKTLTGNVSEEIAKVSQRNQELAEDSRKLMERMDAHDVQVNRLAGHPLIGGVPYRVLHVEEDPSEDYISVHQASSLKRQVGKVYHDAASERAQFFRLSTSTSHEVDTDGKSEVPRCHVLFKGWLPEQALKVDATAFHEGVPTMIELKDGLAEKDQKLRDEPGYDKRTLATFFGLKMPFFTTGIRKTGWVEVTFEGWMAVTNGRYSADSKYKNYMGPALP